MGAGEEGTFTTKIMEHRGRFVYTGSAGRSIAVPLASRWRHHSTATPATTTNGTTTICTMIQPAPDNIAPEANDDSVTVPNTRHEKIVECLNLALFGAGVSAGQQRRGADKQKIPADPKRHIGGPEIEGSETG